MNWRGPSGILALLAALLALVYFATVIWEPGSPEAPAPENYLRELGDLPRDSGVSNDRAPSENSRQAVGDGLPTIGSGDYDLVVQLADADHGAPVVDAVVQVLAAAHPTAPPLLQMQPAADGRAACARLEHAQYRIRVRANGYLPPEDLLVEIPTDGREFRVELEPGANVVGWLQSPAGQPVASGLLRLRHVGSGETHDFAPDPKGSFRSPAVGPGRWDVFWLAHPHQDPDPRLHTQLSLVARQTVSLTMTIPRGEDGAGQIAVVRN